MATVVLRGSTYSMLDDVERAIDDGVNTIKTLGKDPRMLPGAGAVEIALAKIVQDYSKTQPGLDQYAIEAYGQALEIIPKTIAVNAGLKSEAIIAQMYAKTSEGPHGVDVVAGGVKPIHDLEVYDCYDTKSWAVKLTSDVCLTILKVDQIIMSKPSGGPNFESQAARRPDGYDD